MSSKIETIFEIFLVRHGVTRINRLLHNEDGTSKPKEEIDEKKFEEHWDKNPNTELTDTGLLQAIDIEKELSSRYGKIDKIFVSCFKRAIDTAAPFRTAHPDIPVIEDVIYGEWMNDKKGAIAIENGVECIVDGTWPVFADRVGEALDTLFSYKKEGERVKLVVFSHSVFISMALSIITAKRIKGKGMTFTDFVRQRSDDIPSDYEDLSFHLPNGSISKVFFTDADGVIIQGVGLDGHNSIKTGHR